MAPVQCEDPRPGKAQFGRHHRRALQQEERPDPGEAAERQLQAACPVHSDGIRVLPQPVPPLPDGRVGKLLLPGEPIRLGERDQMLVPVEFPGDLRIPNLRKVQVADLEPGDARRPLTVDQVEVPVDLRAVVEIRKTQQVKAVPADLLCRSDNLGRGLRHAAPQQAADFGDLRFVEEEPPLRIRPGASQVLGKIKSPGRSISVDAGLQMLAHAVQQLLPAHRVQPRPAASPWR